MGKFWRAPTKTIWSPQLQFDTRNQTFSLVIASHNFVLSFLFQTSFFGICASFFQSSFLLLCQAFFLDCPERRHLVQVVSSSNHWHTPLCEAMQQSRRTICCPHARLGIHVLGQSFLHRFQIFCWRRSTLRGRFCTHRHASCFATETSDDPKHSAMMHHEFPFSSSYSLVSHSTSKRTNFAFLSCCFQSGNVVRFEYSLPTFQMPHLGTTFGCECFGAVSFYKLICQLQRPLDLHLLPCHSKVTPMHPFP